MSDLLVPNESSYSLGNIFSPIPKSIPEKKVEILLSLNITT
jgi:hypothetical protein